ncbi:K+/H+ antiporter subunit F [Phaeovulum vinaykumarii]|uniref:Multisubunit potassium/proton antiporter, PhaF subunit n=1 Tax=Phaeovulum vinaykumarii TaxID=407234 RepID=A0A1N7K1B1_9RHOB|nr:K+/H+ antiporter subunit F [Phaeovulum vinaykumarii]SIS55358.1 multisubunit potassium/proton antiporter, PhaF subunit [Phaeovulum vinaykumarii]SOB92338.1 multisubunit potassium/proton antiporter PhaF subunit [Phaeovulum vinaykumarii]
MIDLALDFAYVCFGLGLAFTAWRVVRAPGIVDRILALDTMVINAIGLLILLGISEDTGVYFEAAILIAMVGFVSTVAFAKFVLRGDVIE